MTLIDGVGNEVTQFFMVVIGGIIALLAWWSTGQRQNRYRTAVILERNVRNVYSEVSPHSNGHGHTPQTMLIIHQRYTPENSSRVASASANTLPTIVEQPPVEAQNADEMNQEENRSTETNNMEDQRDGPTITAQDAEMSNIVDAMDSDASMLRNRRLAFFTNKSDRGPETVVVKESERESQNNQDGDNLTLPQEENTANDAKEKEVDEKSAEEKEINESIKCDSADNIRIRLKYLNDDLKLVEGRLQEPLGDFKRRHFKGELSARKLVRLIFNGQVLQREAATLESCGLFDNCVVHCLVHQPRTPQQFAQAQQQLNPTSVPLNNNGNAEGQHGDQDPYTENGPQEERDWDLSHILFTLLASLLSIAWYMHIRFSSLFGVAASLAMLGLTGIYIITVVCVYFPETQPTQALNAAIAATPGNRARNSG